MIEGGASRGREGRKGEIIRSFAGKREIRGKPAEGPTDLFSLFHFPTVGRLTANVTVWRNRADSQSFVKGFVALVGETVVVVVMVVFLAVVPLPPATGDVTSINSTLKNEQSDFQKSLAQKFRNFFPVLCLSLN